MYTPDHSNIMYTDLAGAWLAHRATLTFETPIIVGVDKSERVHRSRLADWYRRTHTKARIG
jgi:hypothetical protein